MTKLSVIIVAHNEARDIRRCLESVRFADEIVVFDSGSTDGTPAICREYTKMVFETDWPGDGQQKNRALQEATGEWILSLDADEWIPDPLQKEIISAIHAEKEAAYSIPFQMICFGKIVRYGGWNSAHLRLFKKTLGKFNEVPVHTNVIINGPVGKLSFPIQHASYYDLNEMLEKLNLYTTEAAKLRVLEGRVEGFITALLHSCWTFFNTYILKLGFLDGKVGLILALFRAESCYYRALKTNTLT